MMKRLSILLVFVLLATAVFSLNISAAQSKIKVKVDGEYVKFDVAPYFDHGRVIVPVRSIAEKLGAEVTWDGKNKTAWVNKDKMHIEIPIGKDVMFIHRDDDFSGIPETVNLGVKTNIVKGRIVVPVRFIAQYFQRVIVWDNANSTVIINKPAEFEEITADTIKDNAVLAKWYEDNYKAEGIHFITDKGCTYILVSAGERPTGGYSTGINNITLVSPETAYVSAYVKIPAPDEMVIMMITYPNTLIKLNTADIKAVEGEIKELK